MMKKWKLGILVALNVALTYVVFLVSIHPEKSRFQQVHNSMHDEEWSHILYLAEKYTPPKTIVTIEETKKIRKMGGSRMEEVDPKDREFLERAAGK